MLILILILYQGAFIDNDLDIDSYPGACQDYTRAKLRCCFPLQEDVDAEYQPVGNYNSAPKRKENLLLLARACLQGQSNSFSSSEKVEWFAFNV